jgi:hypothetical protein
VAPALKATCEATMVGQETWANTCVQVRKMIVSFNLFA